MIECPTDHLSLPALFDPHIPDNPVLWAVFKGRNLGRAVVDDIHHPAQCVVRTDAALTFSSRQVSQSFLDEAIAHFRQASAVWLVGSSVMFSQIHPPQADQIVRRVEFYDYDPRSPALDGWRRRLPDGFEIRPIDRQLLERCEWKEDMQFFCGSLDNFLENGLGLCMMQADEIIVEAYVSSFGETQAEIGAVTRSAYRGRGYAPVLCAYLIETIASRSYQAYWSCDADNPASLRVARKLGFQQEKPYQVFEYSPQNLVKPSAGIIQGEPPWLT